MISFGYPKSFIVIKYLNYFKLLNVLFLNILVAFNFSPHCNHHAGKTNIFLSAYLYIKNKFLEYSC